MIKIGVLIKDFNELRNFELRILKYIIDDPELELSILFKDGRKLKNNSNVFYKIIRHIKRGNFLSKVLLILQQHIENKLFRVSELNGKENIIRILEETEQILLNPERKGFLDIFSDEESKLIEGYNLDLILRFEFDIIRGKILNSSKNGIWSFHHGDNKVNRGGPACLWEIILKQNQVGVTLQKLEPELDGGYIIDKGYYNKYWSWIKTRNNVYESSTTLIIKNINKLKRKEPIQLNRSKIYSHKLYKTPSLFYTLTYFSIFYSTLFRKIYRKIMRLLFKYKYGSWTIGLYEGTFLNSVLHKLRPLKCPKNEFWADPFIFLYKNKKYIFFENYEYDKEKGKISCGIYREGKLTDIKDVLIKDYHLSYPNIFKSGEDIFMIPETHKNNQLEIYKCTNFPDKWELFSTGFNGEHIIDCNYFNDGEDNWLFLNKKTENTDGCSDLHIYKIDSLKLNRITPHKNNPVITNSDRARNGGPLFYYDEKLFRPSQINIDGYYGRGLNINEVKCLTIDEYDEEIVDYCIPFFDRNIQGIHHLHQINNFFVTDFCLSKRKI